MGYVIRMPATPFSRAFGKRLRAIRIAEGFESARAFADALGVEPNTLTTWERGSRLPTLETFLRLCQVLPNTDPNRLLVGTARTAGKPASSTVRKFPG